MKGPGIRNDLDVRRSWKCPACGAARKTAGEVQAVRCRCREEVVWMALVEPLRRRPLFPPPRTTSVEISASEMETLPEGEASPPSA